MGKGRQQKLKEKIPTEKKHVEKKDKKIRLQEQRRIPEMNETFEEEQTYFKISPIKSPQKKAGLDSKNVSIFDIQSGINIDNKFKYGRKNPKSLNVGKLDNLKKRANPVGNFNNLREFLNSLDKDIAQKLPQDEVAGNEEKINVGNIDDNQRSNIQENFYSLLNQESEGLTITENFTKQISKEELVIDQPQLSYRITKEPLKDNIKDEKSSESDQENFSSFQSPEKTNNFSLYNDDCGKLDVLISFEKQISLKENEKKLNQEISAIKLSYREDLLTKSENNREKNESSLRENNNETKIFDVIKIAKKNKNKEKDGKKIKTPIKGKKSIRNNDKNIDYLRFLCEEYLGLPGSYYLNYENDLMFYFGKTKVLQEVNYDYNLRFLFEELRIKPEVNYDYNLRFLFEKSPEKPEVNYDYNLRFLFEEVRVKPEINYNYNLRFLFEELPEKPEVSYDYNLRFLFEELRVKPDVNYDYNLRFLFEELPLILRKREERKERKNRINEDIIEYDLEKLFEEPKYEIIGEIQLKRLLEENQKAKAFKQNILKIEKKVPSSISKHSNLKSLLEEQNVKPIEIPLLILPPEVEYGNLSDYIENDQVSFVEEIYEKFQNDLLKEEIQIDQSNKNKNNYLKKNEYLCSSYIRSILQIGCQAVLHNDTHCRNFSNKELMDDKQREKISWLCENEKKKI
jgi:hypothetical protein